MGNETKQRIINAVMYQPMAKDTVMSVTAQV